MCLDIGTESHFFFFAIDPYALLWQIVYWEVTRGAVGRGVEILSSAISGDVASPGALITISKEEVSLPNPL